MSLTVTNTLFGTNPIVLHSPGPLHPDWHIAAAEAITEQSVRPCEDVTVIIWDGPDRPEKPNGVAQRSLERMGVKFIRAYDNRPEWTMRDKHEMTVKALREVMTPYVMGVDSGDLIFLDSPQVACDRFKDNFACELLFMSTGGACWPTLPRFVEYSRSRMGADHAHGRHWLNCGAFIGRTAFCHRYFKAMTYAPYVLPFNTDQCVVLDAWPQWYPQVQLDYECRIFQWFNESRRVMRLERWKADRQKTLKTWISRKLVETRGPNLLGAEIGVFDGHTSEHLLRDFPGLRLWMVDQFAPFHDWPTYTQADWDHMKLIAEYWTEFAGDRRWVLRDPSVEGAQYFADGSLDFVFIDACHVYDAVAADIRAWSPKIRRGGLLTGHDYHLPGVYQAVQEFAASQGKAVETGADNCWLIEV